MVAGYLAITIAEYGNCIQRAVLVERERCARAVEKFAREAFVDNPEMYQALAGVIRKEPEPNPPALAESSGPASPE